MSLLLSTTYVVIHMTNSTQSFSFFFHLFQDHNLGATCPGSSGNVEQYQIKFQTRYFVDTESVNVSRCENGRCSNAFELAKNGSAPSSYDNVSVAAENVVGVGAARTCTTQPISELNFVLKIACINCVHVPVRGSTYNGVLEALTISCPKPIALFSTDSQQSLDWTGELY